MFKLFLLKVVNNRYSFGKLLVSDRQLLFRHQLVYTAHTSFDGVCSVIICSYVNQAVLVNKVNFDILASTSL